MKIAVDAMGGDFAPAVVIEGVIQAVKEFGVNIILVGIEDRIRLELKRFPQNPNIEIYHAPEVVGMDEPAITPIRKKKNSSISEGINLVKAAKADAFFSAGNTGAVVCQATLSLGLLPGIERPGIALIIPTLKGISLIIDVGANIDPKPLHILQYGIMAEAYLHYIFNRPNPTVGLLNIGEEETKGTEFVKETHQLLEKSSLNFIGNVEGKDIFSGKSDIIICDGFVGNVALKVSESAAEAMAEFLSREIKKSLMAKLGVFFMKQALRSFKKNIDYSEYGGASLLGPNGIVIIGHGRSSSKAIKNAIRVAKEEVERGVNDKIIEAIRLQTNAR